MNKNVWLCRGAWIAVALSLPGAGLAKKPDPIDPAALARAQNSDFNASSDVCFSATVAGFQNLSYDIAATDKTSGLVKAVSVGKSKLTYNILLGFGGKKRTQAVTAFVESTSPQTCHIRLTYILATKKTSMFGTRAEDGEPITDATLYQKTFDTIRDEINRRSTAATSTVR